MHAEKVVAAVGRDLEKSVGVFLDQAEYSWFPERSLRKEEDIPEDFYRRGKTVPDERSGYLRSVDYDLLLKIAKDKDLIMLFAFRTGDFVPPDKGVISIWPEKTLEEETIRTLMSAFVFGAHLQWSRNVDYSVKQLVAIAVRALSPGINDPFLAISCLDQLGAALVRLAQAAIPSGYRYDENNRLRLITDSITFQSIMDTAFNQIRQNSYGVVSVILGLMETLISIAEFAVTGETRDALLKHADMIKRGSDRSVPEEQDREDINSRYSYLCDLLNRG